MRKKMALSVVAIALAMLLSFGVAIDQASADAILFPWIVKSTAISTIVSVVNTAGINPLVPPFGGTPQLHLSYFYKDPDNNQTTSCQDYDFKIPTSEMDIVTFDASGNINGGLPMFGDPNNGAGTLELLAPGDRRAFLIVDNNTPLLSLPTQLNNVDGTLYGEAMVLEFAQGAAWGYVAYNSAGPFGDTLGVNPLIPPYGGGQNGFVSFSNGLDPHGEVIGQFLNWAPVPPATLTTAPNVFVAGELAPVVFLPQGQVNTRMFMTPTDMISAAIAYAGFPGAPVQSQFANTGQRNGNIDTRVGVCAIPAYAPGAPGVPGILTGGCTLPGLHLNDESPLSSTKLKNIVCTSADDVAALLDAATETAWVANGGQAWTYIRTALGNLLPAGNYEYSPNMMIGKLEWDDTATTIDGQAVTGTFNNFVHIRNNFITFAGIFPFGINNLHPQP